VNWRPRWKRRRNTCEIRSGVGSVVAVAPADEIYCDARILFAAGLFGVMLLQSHRLCDVVELLAGDGFKLFAARLEFFVDLDGLLRHLLMRLLRAADEGKVWTGGDALVSVGIQSHAEQHCLGFLLGVCHLIEAKARV